MNSDDEDLKALASFLDSEVQDDPAPATEEVVRENGKYLTAHQASALIYYPFRF